MSVLKIVIVVVMGTDEVLVCTTVVGKGTEIVLTSTIVVGRGTETVCTIVVGSSTVLKIVVDPVSVAYSVKVS